MQALWSPGRRQPIISTHAFRVTRTFLMCGFRQSVPGPWHFVGTLMRPITLRLTVGRATVHARWPGFRWTCR